jgi:zinc D-Ala-D-Ala carboxypeptidase
MNLSRNFSLQELIKSDTAIRKGINNNPNSGQIEKLKALCENILQPVRDHFGRVKVTSGFRSEDLCLAIGSLEIHSMQKLRPQTSNVLELIMLKLLIGLK